MFFGRVLVVSRKIEIQQLGRSVAREILVADNTNEAIDIISSATASTSPDLIIFDVAAGENEIKSFLDATDNNCGISAVIIGDSDNVPSWLAGFPQFCYISFENAPHKLSTLNITSSFSELECSIPANSLKEEFFADGLTCSVSMAGKSRALHHTLKMIRLIAESNCNPVLITGETGTGKELAAKAVHLLRHPKEQFVAVNCAALTANLLESELFGHVRGAFTSADKDKTGLLELAGQGSVFLDEISEIPLELQAKLLRVLQEKTFRKVGGVSDIKFAATIITSSNRDLRREVRENRFRRDLYYRLNTCPINIAPLRDMHRQQDIRLLANYFLKTSTVSPAKIGKITAFTELALQRIEQHCWPGNVRELRNVIDRAILLETTDKIGLSSIQIETLDQLETEFPIENCQFQIENRNLEISNPLDFSLEKAERELIARALQESGWQKTKAAMLLGITRATLYAKVKQHNIQQGVYIPRTVAVS
jgi:transcriptional regulator with GAF, ATPase, and Fis domain